ncbi:integrase, catalytic region, zinc finger, CCHC-type containing protein [Tanacetum coccineum]
MLEIAKKEILLENDRLLQKIMSQDVLLTVINSMSWNNDSVNMEMQTCDSCEKCLNLDAELSKSKQAYNDLLKNYSQLEKHCISLEVSMQLKQEVFQNDESCVNHNGVKIQEYFEINDLKARLQDKDTTIYKLKDTIKSLRENTKEENVFKDQFDSIKQTRVRHKEQSDSLINKLNLKSVENEDLKAQNQDKVFVITSLKNNLRKLKGKEIVENVVHTPSATTIAPGMFKLDLEPLPPRLLQNREVHITYLRNTQEQANILREIVEQAKAKQPLDSELDLACKYATRIQELLVYVQDMCPNAIIPSAKKVTVKPMNNVKKVRSEVNNKNKVEAQPRKVNKVNRVVKPVGDVDVKHSLSKANSGILCATCNKSMFDGVHDKCLLDLMGLQNALSCLDSTLNDQIARIMGYDDYQLGNVIISRVHCVEGLGHNLFSVGQFCDEVLEVAFQKNTCFIPNLEGVDLLSWSRDTNLYTISLDDMLKSSPIYLLSKASKTKSWLWHCRLSHLNFGTFNKLAKDGLARGIPRL